MGVFRDRSTAAASKRALACYLQSRTTSAGKVSFAEKQHAHCVTNLRGPDKRTLLLEQQSLNATIARMARWLRDDTGYRQETATDAAHHEACPDNPAAPGAVSDPFSRSIFQCLPIICIRRTKSPLD